MSGCLLPPALYDRSDAIIPKGSCIGQIGIAPDGQHPAIGTFRYLLFVQVNFSTVT